MLPGRLAGRLLQQRLAQSGTATRTFFLPSVRSAGYASESAPERPKGWVPQWLRERLPAAVGGVPVSEESEELTLDKFASTLKRARRLGSVTSYLPGSAKLSDSVQSANLQQYETIIGAMSNEDKADLSRFTGVARQRVAQAAGCSVAQVDDCIAKYHWMRAMLTRVAEAKRQGKPMPKSIEDMERSVGGTWQKFKTEAAQRPHVVQQDGRTPHRVAPSGEHIVPLHAVSPKGGQCPLAGQTAGRNTKCPATKKAYKACCGRQTLR